MSDQQPPHSIVLFGTDEPDEKGRLLRAGPLSVEFQNGQLRYVRAGGIEIMRAVAFLVRDESWGTFNTEISNLKVVEGKDKFRISYEGRCADGAIVYLADIHGDPTGLSFAARLSVRRDFRTNRTGFVILHPLKGCVGCPVEIEHVDGRMEQARFPNRISAYQPFFAIRALKHEFAPGAFVLVRLEGDTFEMEDQRNWSDASFKTYVRPIGLPWPYELAAGKELEQRVSLRIDGRTPAQSSALNNGPVRITLGSDTGKMPQIRSLQYARAASR
jgi:D-apionolactonase